MRYYSSSAIDFSVALICGMGRTGKTLIGNVISTCENVEYTEEPWTVTNIAQISQTNFIDKNFAQEMLCGCVKNLFDETYLMRSVNFRPIDLSYIGRKKTHEEINYRINNLKSYRDVRNKQSVFVINLSEILNELDFIYGALSNCKIIYVVRDAISVVNEAISKGWYTDSWLTELDKAYMLRKFKDKYLPTFVEKGKEQYFLNLNHAERCFYYYNAMMKKAFSSKVIKEGLCTLVRYEDFVQHPRAEYNTIREYLKLKDGKYTDIALSKIYSPKEERKIPNDVDHVLLEETNRYLKVYGYEEIV